MLILNKFFNNSMARLGCAALLAIMVLAIQGPILSGVTAQAPTPSPTAAPAAPPAVTPAAQGLFGELVAKDDASITILSKRGPGQATIKLAVNKDTQIRLPGADAPGTLADVPVGSRVAILARGPETALTVVKIMPVPAEPRLEHRLVTVVEIKGKAIVGQDDRGQKVEVELELGPGKTLDSLIGQLITVVGAPGQIPDSFRARATVRLEEVAQQMEDRVQKLEVEIKVETNGALKAQKQQVLEQLKLILDDSLQKHLDRLSEAIASLTDDNQKSVLRDIQIEIRKKAEDARNQRGRSSLRPNELELRHHGKVEMTGKMEDKNAITIKSDTGGTVTLKVADNPSIRRGRGRGSMEDIMGGLAVTVKIDDRTGLVREIEIEDRNEVKGTIQSFDRASGQLVVKQAGGMTQTFKITPGTSLDVQGRGDAISALVPGAPVEVKFNSATMEATMVEVKTKEKTRASIKDINLAERTITLVSTGGAETRIKLDDATRIDVRGLLSGAQALKPGQEIEVEFEPATGKALRIKAIEDRSGPSGRSGPSRGRGGFGDLGEGELRGAIQSMDQAAGKVTVGFADGASLTLKLSQKSLINTQRGPLQPGAIVEVKFDPATMEIIRVEVNPDAARGREAEARGREAEGEGTRGREAEARGREAEGEAPRGANSGGGGSSGGGGGGGRGGGGR